jgi:hypothetical protein
MSKFVVGDYDLSKLIKISGSEELENHNYEYYTIDYDNKYVALLYVVYSIVYLILNIKSIVDNNDNIEMAVKILTIITIFYVSFNFILYYYFKHGLEPNFTHVNKLKKEIKNDNNKWLYGKYDRNIYSLIFSKIRYFRYKYPKFQYVLDTMKIEDKHKKFDIHYVKYETDFVIFCNHDLIVYIHDFRHNK